MTARSLSIVILTYNTKTLLAECLSRFYQQFASIGVQLIVVDNASSDGTSDMIRADFPLVELITSPQNIGYAGGNNLGIRQATGELVILLNSDVLASPATLLSLADELLKRTDAGAISAGLITKEKTPQAFAYGDEPTIGYLMRRGFRAIFKLGPLHRWDIDAPIEVDWISGACMCVRAEVIKKAHLLDDRFFLYFEDVDWCRRIRHAGWHIVYDPRFSVIHLGGASQPQRYLANQTYYKSMIIFYQKHYGPAATLALRLMLPIYSRVARR